KKSLNESLVSLQANSSKEIDWVRVVYANEKVCSEPAELLKHVQQIPADIDGRSFPVRSIEENGRTEQCEFATRCVRLHAQPYTEFLDTIQLKGTTSKSKITLERDIHVIRKNTRSTAFTRMRDNIVRYWERYPGDLSAAFAFYQFLQWTDDFDEIVNNYTRTLENHRTVIQADSSYWSLYTIWGEACYQVREREKFRHVFLQATKDLPENHLDALYLKCLNAKFDNKHEEIIQYGEQYQAKSTACSKNVYKMANEGVHSLKYEVSVRAWRIASLARLQKWPAVFSNLRGLTKIKGFDSSRALDLLQDLQLVSGDKSATLLKILWTRFQTPQFVRETLKIFPLDTLEDKSVKFLVDDLTPKFMQEQEFEAGLLLMQMGLFEFAYEIFIKYKNDSGVGESAMFNAAQMALEIGRFEEAIQLLADLLHEYPANKDARLLYEGLTPDVGTVENPDMYADIDMEETLLEAADAIQYYIDKNKFDPIFTLVKQVHDVMAPYSEIKVEIYGDLPGALARIESLAISHNYLKLADKIQDLRTTFSETSTEEKTVR
ncbi:MAG: tetratricopeptide repeat protein, partial [Calditrichaeota bacterium]